MTYARIAGVGSYLPKKILTNHDLEKIMDTSDEWIRERTGIKRRHIAGEDETTASMGLEAARRALDMAEIDASEIDLIIVGTCTPDKVIPASACIIQRRLGIEGGGALDVPRPATGRRWAKARRAGSAAG